MIKIKKYSQSQLIDYFQQYKESRLRLNINDIKGQENSYLQAIETSLGNLIHLQELEVLVKKNCILLETGYIFLSNTITNLKNLTKLKIKIENLCYLDNSGLISLTNSIQSLSELQEFSLHIGFNNYISQQSVKYFMSSIKGLKNLAKLQLYLKDIMKDIEEGNISVWNELHQLSQLEELKIQLNFDNFSNQDILEFFNQIIFLKNLLKLKITLISIDTGTFWIDRFIYSLSQLQKLKILKCENNNGEQFIFNNQQIKQLYSSFSGLKLLEEFQLTSIQDQILSDNAEQYFRFIQGFKNLTKFSINIPRSFIQTKEHQIMIGECLKHLSNMTELDLTLGDRQFKFYDVFILDLSEAIQNMGKLNVLVLNLFSQISELGYKKLGESLVHLNNLESFNITFDNYKNIKNRYLLLYNIRFLTQLKHLDIKIVDYTNDFDHNLLFQSMQYLINLQSLHLQQGINFQGWFDGFINIKNITSVLRKLIKLNELQLNIRIQNSDDQKSIQEFIGVFQCLNNLSYLNISFQTVYQKEQQFEMVHCLQHLENLKILSIYLNQNNNYKIKSFVESITNLKSIQKLAITILEDIDYFKLIQILSALKQSTKLQHLELNIRLVLSNQQNELFSAACFGLKHLQVLKIEDQKQIISKEDPLLFYGSGIKELTNLKQLFITCSQGELTDIGALKFSQALQNQQNLRLLNLELNCRSKITQKGERFLSIMINQLQSLKKIKLKIGCQGILGNQIFNSSLGLKKLNKIFISTIYEDNESFNQLESHDVLEEDDNLDKELTLLKNKELNEDRLNECSSQVTDIFLKFKINGKKPDFFQELNHQLSPISNLMYLNRLSIKIEFSFQLQSMNLDLLNDFSKLNRLNVLDLYTRNILFEKSTIEQIIEGFKHTQNLEFLYLHFENSLDSDYLLMEGISCLKNLHTLELSLSLSDKGAVSLGNSLYHFKYLKQCLIQIQYEDEFSQEGLVQIENGLSSLQNLIQLTFKLCEQVIDNQNKYSPQLGQFLNNMKRLDRLTLQIGKNNYYKLFGGIDVMRSLNSLSNLTNLSIDIEENNKIDSENLGEFLEYLPELKNLNEMEIKIMQQQKEIFLKSKFANIFNNKSKHDTLILTFEQNQVTFRYLNYEIAIQQQQNNEIQVIDIDFFYSLDKLIPIDLNVLFNFSSESRFYKALKSFNFVSINISFDCLINETTYYQFCDSISYWKNTNVLKINGQLTFSSLNNNPLALICERISELKSLYTLNLAVYLNNEQQQLDQYINLIDILSKLKQLKNLAIDSSNYTINKKIIPILQKKFKQLITLEKVYYNRKW